MMRPPNKEVLAGLFFVAAGVATVALCSGRDVGSPSQMGPYFFPIVLGGVLIVLGALACASSLADSSVVDPMAFDGIRSSLLVPVAAASFALVEYTGLVFAVCVTVIIACFAGREVRGWEIVANAIILAIATPILFVYLLDMPWPLFPPLWSSQ